MITQKEFIMIHELKSKDIQSGLLPELLAKTVKQLPVICVIASWLK